MSTTAAGNAKRIQAIWFPQVIPGRDRKKQTLRAQGSKYSDRHHRRELLESWQERCHSRPSGQQGFAKETPEVSSKECVGA